MLSVKVSYFFRIWILWLKFSDYSIEGNTKNLSKHESFVSNHCYLNVQLSCHFVVLVFRFFKDFHSHMPIPVHLIGSDACEIFFVK